MRTTIDIPEELIKKAMKLTHAKTKTTTIVIALTELINRYKLSELRKFRGKFDLNIDLKKSRAR